MVVKMIKWPLSSRKFEVKILIKRLEGLGDVDVRNLLTAEIKWKGSKMIGLRSLRGVKRSLTSGGFFDDGGIFQWNQEFRNFCSFLGFKDGGFGSWEVVISVVNGSSKDLKNKALVVGSASLNLGEYVSSTHVEELGISVPLTLADGRKGFSPLLMMSLTLIEVKCAPDTVEPVYGSIGIVGASRKSTLSPEKERATTLGKGRKKVNLFKGCVTSPKREMAYPEDGNSVKVTNKNSDCDTDTVDDLHEDGISDEGGEETYMLQPLSYGPLTYVNFGHSISSYTSDFDDWIYYSDRKRHVESSAVENAAASVQSSVRQIPKHRFLSWRKRKLGFRSAGPKGEPLLKKDCRDEGGDDIDFDRRQLTSSDESSYGWNKTEDGSTTSRSSFSEFEDEEGFFVGNWEKKEITSRDGRLILDAQVFFASMDQRSERAAGESACTSLVAVIAEWLQRNRCEMPIKSQFDRLIKDGSSEWRSLCDTEMFMKRFPDKHFDLETVLEAKSRSVSVVPEKSFIGFFHPEGIEEESFFDILHGSMSFDEIWDEISRQALECDTTSSPLVYIVSWNDHFFILKVERDTYYIIDTLGERLFEGCNQAYTLKFDRDTTIKQVSEEANASVATSSGNDESISSISSGKESCKDYINNFMAAIPIRQLQTDIMKGLTSTVSLHQRLQIEFHFTDIML